MSPRLVISSEECPTVDILWSYITFCVCNSTCITLSDHSHKSLSFVTVSLKIVDAIRDLRKAIINRSFRKRF